MTDKGARWTPAENAVLQRHYADGLSDAAIACQLGRTEAAVKWRRKTLGLSRRHIRGEHHAAVRRLAGRGMTDADIGRLLGLSRGSVKLIRSRLGLTAGQFVAPRKRTRLHAIPVGSLDECSPSQLTTGGVAKICNVSPRTAAKWIDSGKLKGWKIPGGTDRRVLPADLVAFLEAVNAPVPASLHRLVFGRPEVVLYRCPPFIGESLAGVGADIVYVESPWALAMLFAVPSRCGVVVCGDGSPRSEIEDVFANTSQRWLKVHARGPDQEPAEGADVALPGDDLTGLLGAVAKHLLGGR